jgi:hypothetical protein
VIRSSFKWFAATVVVVAAFGIAHAEIRRHDHLAWTDVCPGTQTNWGCFQCCDTYAPGEPNDACTKASDCASK